jgi:D-alanine-D-alanine ligase
LMGGSSTEREISLKSGEAIARGLATAGHEVATYDLNPGEGRGALALAGSHELAGADVVFLALHGGEGEDGRIQALLELAGKPYTGSGVRASAICMDKVATKIILGHYGVETPGWVYLTRDEASVWANDGAIAALGLPVVVKPVDQGSSIGLTIAQREDEIGPAVSLALRYSRGVVFEEYVAGRELSVPIVGEEVYPIVEIKPKQGFYDYQRKYTKGMTDYQCPAAIDSGKSASIQADSLKAYTACGCEGFARVDFRLGPDGVAYFLEINTIPGMTETSLVPMGARARGVTFDRLVDRIAAHGLKRGIPAEPGIGG